jgi:hypothetical protein
MPTHDEVLRAVQSVPVGGGLIVFDAATGKTLARRDPADPPIEHSAVLIAFNPPPLGSADPRSGTPSKPLVSPSDPAGGSVGGTGEGMP